MELAKSNLNRSISEPDILLNTSDAPYFRQVFVKEVYQLPNQEKPLIRQYSCREIIGHIDGAKSLLKEINCRNSIDRHWSENNLWAHPSITTKSKSICNNYTSNFSPISALNIASLNDTVHNVKQQLSENLSSHTSNTICGERGQTPMEVDSFEDSKGVDSYMQRCYDNISNKKANRDVDVDYDYKTRSARRLNTTSSIPKQKSDNSKFKFRATIVISVLIPCLCFMFYRHVSENNLEETRQRLEEARKMFTSIENILCQDHVKTATLLNLHQFYEQKTKRVLIFVGSTGVGKTYTVNLIKRHFPDDNINNVNFALQNHIDINEFSSNDCYLVVIDNLKIDQLENVLSYIATLPEKCILVVPIFNIHDIDDNMVYTVNYNHFKNIRYEFEKKFPTIANVVLFNNINRNAVEEWLRDQIKEREISNKEEAIVSLADEHDVEVYGFKGLAAKITTLGL